MICIVHRSRQWFVALSIVKASRRQRVSRGLGALVRDVRRHTVVWLMGWRTDYRPHLGTDERPDLAFCCFLAMYRPSFLASRLSRNSKLGIDLHLLETGGGGGDMSLL